MCVSWFFFIITPENGGSESAAVVLCSFKEVQNGFSAGI